MLYKFGIFVILLGLLGPTSGWADIPKAIILRPNGPGDYTNVPAQLPDSGEHWDKVNEETPDDYFTCVFTSFSVGLQGKDAYALQDTTTIGIIDSVAVYFRIAKEFVEIYDVYATPYLRLDSTESAGTQVEHNTVMYYTYNQTLPRPGGGNWTWQDINELQVAIDLQGYKVMGCILTQIYVKVHYTAPESWRVQLKGLSNFAGDTLNYAGVEFDATDTFDFAYDIPEPPTSPSPYLQLYFPHPEWNHNLGEKFRTDIRKSMDLSDTSMIWDFYVKTDRKSVDVSINAIPFDVPTNYGIYILDLHTGNLQDMRALPVYTYNSEDDTLRKLWLIVGKPPSRRLKAGWHIISVPLIPDAPNPATIFSNCSPYYLYTFTQMGGYITPDLVRNGWGYWLGLTDTCELDAQGTPLSDEDTCFIPLGKGWNLVGNGFYTSIWLEDVKVKKDYIMFTVADAVDSGWVQPILYGYEDDNYYVDSLLSAWEGHWFLALVDGCTFVETKTSGSKRDKGCRNTPWRVSTFEPHLPVILNPSLVILNEVKNLNSFRAGSVKNLKINADNWRLKIMAKCGNISDNITTLGINEGATDGFDNWYDYLEPPAPPGNNYLEVYFKREGWVDVGAKFNQDIRAPIENNETKSWTFEVALWSATTLSLHAKTEFLHSKTKVKRNETITLSWPKIDEVPKELEFILTDIETGTAINMRELKSYTYNVETYYNTPHGFRIDVRFSKNTSVPKYNFGLICYPNPFYKSTVINYQIPSSKSQKSGKRLTTCYLQFVTLKLYDLSGRLIKTLVDKKVKSGQYRTTLDSKKLTSGIYFLKFKVGKFETTKKITVMH